MASHPVGEMPGLSPARAGKPAVLDDADQAAA